MKMSRTLDELDRLAAEKIMGWTYTETFNLAGVEVGPGIIEKNNPAYCWQPTRNIAQAWELLEKFPAMQFFMRNPGVSPRFECILYRHPEENSVFINEAETASLAIVKACLKAKGISC